jgi:mannose-1-phosphate guanylyltransferase
MKAVLLAAGLGTRLRPITNLIPKCLVQIHGVPLLEIWLKKLVSCNFGPIIINTHYLHKQVEEFINKSEFKDVVVLRYEQELLGTAGTIINNSQDSLGGDLFVAHADNYFTENIQYFLDAHAARPSYCKLTMMTFDTNKPENCGIVELDKRGVAVNFHEKKNEFHGYIANGAIYILTNKLIKEMSSWSPSPIDFSKDVLPRLAGKIYTYHSKNPFIDIGTPDNYKKANMLE